ncbi:TPA: DUF2441 domain-containing protein [Enterobacter hormaechei]|uniref:DUF2441 domain-containing protein n=1 Tax=Enterobacter hormaechei TaxID=158836 RepID=UPI0012551DC8|nr:DUF2441 domain-containing protein [Enterobacter hormaechei]VAF65898.1 Uncharacterised protein [Enterobacter hormaechei]HBL5507400.1 DUF2441 domain-containing protein [Enterobacter hormaechei]HBL8835885.1 DUF2441 domain-containing protein [Enterobacter hormaechei]HBL9036085.1 DUF2441 domain-containing protein [Enterobacter hormaechei]HBL9109104.1 DUF2441 domain-containing protein [Enterobacter hormaechei]
MTIYYTADRLRQLQAGMTLPLYQLPQNLNSAFLVQDMYDLSDLENMLADQYPLGVSFHGMRYLLNNENYLYENGLPTAYVTYSPAVEIIFENFRRAHFPERPSRFQCAFGCESPEEALRFFGDSNLPVFEISTANRVFVADETFLKIAPNHLATLFLAKRYWSGDISTTPKLEVMIECNAEIGNKVRN